MNIVSGGYDVFLALAYGEQSPVAAEYFKSQMALLPTIQVIGDIGRSFVQGAKATYERFNNSEAMQLVRAATRQAAALFQPEVIRSIFDFADLQTATITMQRWIMANPMIRKMYHDQRCEGYSDTYVDADPGKVGEAHYDYRRVMSGVVQVEEDSWEAKFYIDNLRDGDQELSNMDKTDILSTWRIAELFMGMGESDPTSPWNAKL